MLSHALKEKKAHPEGGCIQIEPFNTQQLNKKHKNPFRITKASHYAL